MRILPGVEVTSLTRLSVAGCRIGRMPFVVGVKAVIGTAPYRGEVG
jgi:hypothetical protein